MARLWRVKDSQKGREWERVSEERLIDWINKGLLKNTDLVTPEGESSWRPAKDVPELGGAVEDSPRPEVRRVSPPPPKVEAKPAAPPEVRRVSPPPRKVKAKPAAPPVRAEPEPAASAKAAQTRARPMRQSGHGFGMSRSLSGTGAGDSEEESELELTPMIDVTFLLLIFFMVTATMSDPALVLTPEAESGLGVPPENKVLICISRDEAGGEVMFFQDPPKQEFTMDNLRGLLQERLLKHNARDVIIKADGGVDFGQVQKVMDIVSGFDAGRLLIGVREKQ